MGPFLHLPKRTNKHLIQPIMSLLVLVKYKNRSQDSWSCAGPQGTGESFNRINSTMSTQKAHYLPHHTHTATIAKQSASDLCSFTLVLNFANAYCLCHYWLGHERSSVCPSQSRPGMLVEWVLHKVLGSSPWAQPLRGVRECTKVSLFF